MIDLDAYLRRIDWQGPVRPDLATLAGLLDAHMRAIPFENFDVLLGLGIPLDLPALEAKLVRARRGGYCFEHATLFAAVLEAAGFEVTRHLARVLLFRPRDEAARTHMFVAVEIDGARYAADPGFGGLGARVPVPVPVGGTGVGDASGMPHGGDGAGAGGRVVADGIAHAFALEGGEWVLHAEVDGRDQPCWVSPMTRETPLDIEMANHFTATWPQSAFRERLMLRALTPRGRVSVMNREVTIREGEGGARAERRFELADRHALRELVARDFGFDLPQIATLRVPSVPGWD